MLSSHLGVIMLKKQQTLKEIKTGLRAPLRPAHVNRIRLSPQSSRQTNMTIPTTAHTSVTLALSPALTNPNSPQEANFSQCWEAHGGSSERSRGPPLHLTLFPGSSECGLQLGQASSVQARRELTFSYIKMSVTLSYFCEMGRLHTHSLRLTFCLNNLMQNPDKSLHVAH